MTGERFRIDEPDLLRWIHVTATESFCSTATRAGLRLSPAEIDRYYDEQRAVAGLMGLNEGTVPATATDVDAYYDAMRPKLTATQDALATARYLAVPVFPWGLGYTPRSSTVDRCRGIRVQPAATMGPPNVRDARPTDHRSHRHRCRPRPAVVPPYVAHTVPGRPDLPGRHGAGQAHRSQLTANRRDDRGLTPGPGTA